MEYPRAKMRTQPAERQSSPRKILVPEKIGDWSAQQNFDGQAFVFVFVGRLLPQKEIAVHPANGSNDFNRSSVGHERIAIGHMQLRAAAELAGKFVKRRLKPVFSKVHAGQLQLIQFANQSIRIDEGSAKYFKRPGRPPPFRNIRSFKKTHAG